MNEKPTFEELVGNTEAQQWDNDVSDGELSIVSALANKQLQLVTEVAELEADLKAKKEELRLTSEQELPDAMQAAGLTQIKLNSGENKMTEKEYLDLKEDLKIKRKRILAQPLRTELSQDMVDNLLKGIGEGDYIQLPGEVTAKGQFLSQLQIFLENNRGAKDRQDVLQGMVYEHETYFFFKPQSFRDF